jgi:hypothetical protein
MYITDELYFDERDMDPKYWSQSERLKEPVSKVEFRHPEPGFIEVRNKIHILQEDADKKCLLCCEQTWKDR